jgi:hypothetical protein
LSHQIFTAFFLPAALVAERHQAAVGLADLKEQEVNVDAQRV